ncbi:MAG TPA: pitrilysin family protein, partial [Bacteroidales bacterium]|nr:pitrilysin family protein [Bacteroidales bacterium]
MKKTTTILLSLLMSIQIWAQIDRSVRPEPGPAPIVEIGKAQSFELPNGLKVFVVENNKIPQVTFSVIFDYDPVFEGDAAGFVDITGQLIKTGTTTRSKEQIDEEIDHMGASISANATSLHASGLSRNTEQLSALIADIIINANFEERHFSRIKTQMLSELAANKTSPSGIASRVSRVLFFGANHPYGVNVTESSLERVTLEKCVAFYKNHFRPGSSYMAIVGDVRFEDIKRLIERDFGAWKAGEAPEHDYPFPSMPSGTQVALIDRPNAVQSTIIVGFPVNLKPGADDAIAARVMNRILGGSTSRLFYNLRETHGFTYGAYSDLNSDEVAGSFSAFTDVRNIATDSAVYEILYEINRIRYEKVPQDELQLFKNELNGSFAIALENPQTIASFALNTARYSLSEDYYTTYLQRLALITQEDVALAANNHLHPDNAYIIVVGRTPDIADNLRRFAYDGKIRFFDEDGIEYAKDEKLRPAPAGITAETVTNNYIRAIGGQRRMKRVRDITTTMTTTMQGMPITITSYNKAPNKYRMEIGSGGVVFNTQIFDGKKGIISSPMGSQEMPAEMVESLKFNAML